MSRGVCDHFEKDDLFMLISVMCYVFAGLDVSLEAHLMILFAKSIYELISLQCGLYSEELSLGSACSLSKVSKRYRDQKRMGKSTLQVSGFPLGSSAETVKEFLEAHTGEGTIYALKIREPKLMRPKSKLFAIVQFTSARYADHITSEAGRKLLKFGMFPLYAREAERDIVPKPKLLLSTLESITLHLGCQISKKEFFALWEVGGVTVNFGFGLRRMEFFLTYRGVEYKLELNYSSIWKIELHRQHGHDTMFLLIQVQAAPRVYKKNSRSSKNIYDDPILNYFKDSSDDQWVRTTDFTPSACIGQSSFLCLEIPQNFRLPDIGENFYFFKESSGEFCLKAGYSYSRSFNLVPIVEPTSVQLPYKILFKVNSLVQEGILVGPTLDSEFYNLVDPHTVPISQIEHGLEILARLKNTCFHPAKFLQETYKSCPKPKRSSSNSDDFLMEHGLVSIHRIQVTPSKVYFCRPEVIVSNRVLRNYSEDTNNFLRVSFVDEDAQKIRSTDLVLRNDLGDDERQTDVYKRILSTLRNGIVIGKKRFEFLAFSSSQLRENSLYMFAPRNGLSAADIRRWMGDFSDIRNVAKYAARLGQSFSSSKETLSVSITEVAIIPDVEVSVSGKTKYTFSDGIGKISAEFARKVGRKHQLRTKPSAFQIRYAGYKGVVAIDPHSTCKMSLRKSMYKYKSVNTKLDILAWSKYQPCFLNRQLITLLSTLGVPDHTFEKRQREIVEQLDTILVDPIKAQEALEFMCPGENTRILKEMLMCGYKPGTEPFLSMMLQAFRESKLSELRMKSRIFVPHGRCMMGCLDETRTLDYGQVFVKASYVNQKQFYGSSIVSGLSGTSSGQGSFVVEGRVVVAKNPCLHPGDIRILNAVDVPALHHMVDCAVFPQKGERPHPNECSGSDLDGDIYFVCWDPELIPPRQVPPMEYDTSPPKIVDHDVTIEEVEEYFANYMVNDSLGVIANAHVVFADKEALKAESASCLELSNLFSVAVDFPKTGVPAEIPPRLQVKEYPDFMEKLDRPTYESRRVIGKLYRAVKEVSSDTGYVKFFTFDMAKKIYDPDMEVADFEDYAMDAYYYKGKYDFKLGNLMDHYRIKNEAEIISGSIMELPNISGKKKNTEAIALEVRSLRKEARHWFDEKGTGNDQHTAVDVYAKASAWYHVTYHPDYWGDYNEGLNRPHFLSFAWVVHDKLITIKKRKMQQRRAH